MSRRSRSHCGYDAVVVGGGPNGLSAAITFARAGRSVLLLEAADEIGGACRSAPLLGPGWVNDLGSAIHPIARASPFFAGLDLESHGLQWITPPASVGQPLDPNKHQAMMETPSADAAPGTILIEMQAGYMIKDRLLRPALVSVAKAPE